MGTTSVLGLDHTLLAAADWARGEHLTQAGPIRILIPGNLGSWDQESDEALGTGLDKLYLHSGDADSQVLSRGNQEGVKDISAERRFNEEDARDEESPESLFPVLLSSGCTPTPGLLKTKPLFCLNCIQWVYILAKCSGFIDA